MSNKIQEIFDKERRKKDKSIENINRIFSSYSNSNQETPRITTSVRQYKNKDDFIKSTSSKAFFNNKQDEDKKKIEEIFNNRRAENNTKEQEINQNTSPKLTKEVKEYSNLFSQNIDRTTQNITGTDLNKDYDRTQSKQRKPIVPMKINTEELQDPQKVTWNDIKAKKEAEQINEDIKEGNYSSSVGHILNSFLGGVKQSASGIASTVLLPIGGVTKKLSESNIVNDKWKEKLSDFSDDVFDASEYIGEQGNYSSNVNSQVDNNMVKTGGQVSNVLGNLATSVLANVIAPGSGATVNAVTVGGNSAQETLNEDRNNVAQSMLTGATKGYISKKVEGITGGNFLSKGNLDDLATRTIEKNIKSNLGKEIATRGYQVLGEMGEEQIEDNLGYVVDKLINDKDLPDFQEWWNQTGETNKVTFLSTLALQMVGLGGSTRNNSENIYNDVDTKTANKWINEAKKIIEKENINTGIQTTQNSSIIPINKNQNTNQNVQEVQSTPIVPVNQEKQNTQKTTVVPINDNSQGVSQNIQTAQSNPIIPVNNNQNNPIIPINKNNISNNFNTYTKQSTEKQNRLEYLKSIDVSNMKLLEKSKIKSEIRALENGYDSVEEMRQVEKEREQDAIRKHNNKTLKDKKDTTKSSTKSSFNLPENYAVKEKQLNIIQKTNPMLDDDHVGIRTVDDIQTFKEAYETAKKEANDGGWKEYASYPDITNEMIENSLKTGEITIYSSYNIENGTFVTPSYEQALEYAGNDSSKVKRKKVKLEDVAWINLDEGQYAKIVENTSNKLYNNDRGDVNAKQTNQRNDRRRVQGLLELYEKGQRYGDSNSEKLYGIKETEEVTERKVKQDLISYANQNKKRQLTSIEQRLKQTINDLGGEVVFYEYGPENYFQGLADKNTFYIDSSGDSNVENVFYHELVHFLRQNKNESYIKEIEPIVNEIASDFDYQEAIFNYAKSSSDYFDIRDLDGRKQHILAEEVVADQVASIYGNLKADYGLNEEIKQSIKKSMDKILTKNKENISENKETPIVPINKKTMNPTEISNIKLEEASTTPKLPNRRYEKGNKQSSFYNNLVTDSKFLSEDFRKAMGQDENIKYYKEITNKDTLEKAYKELQDGGEKDVIGWFSKEGKDADATDVSKGWILLKEYQDNGDFENAVRVAKKMRDIGTTAGQTIQAFNIMSRLTPEGMTMYAQSELTEAYNKMVKGKTQKWIDENYSKFKLSPSETAFIKDTMEQVATMEDGYDKKVKLAEIQKVITDKIPPAPGQAMKSWMRISMLFNPKTQIRNVAGNAVVLPLHTFSDMFASAVDKALARKTGVRTTGNVNLKNYAKGFGKGIYESYNDFRKGINTRNIQGNRFEVNEGKNFKDKGIGKALNRVDNMLSFMLDAGDRGFYEASFNNSINNQMVLNNSTEITQEMLDIATNEALQRTWQDNNEYTKSVLKIRKILNKINMKGYGLGDVLIPFAKTPANLTKAIVDYSPIGLTKTLAHDARKLMNAIETNQYTPQMQHAFVQNLGKGFSGSFLYILGYALAKTGITTGEADEDKDVRNFMKNSLGISSYSIKIGNKSFTYDWAQPIAAPFAIMANYVKKQKENPDALIIEKAFNVLATGFDLLLEQSFMDSINSVANGSGSFMENLQNAVLELPARAVPTFSKQIADMVDGTQRTTFEYEKPVKSAINSVIAKIPFASKTLAPVRDTLGNEVKKYGGENNVFNVFINPANTNKGELSKAGEEIYKVYQETGETNIFPVTAPYYINNNGDNITMDSKQRAEYQKIAGTYVEDTLDALLSNSTYKNLTNSQKADLIADIVSDSNARAKYKVLNIESKDAKKKRVFIDKIQPQNYYDYQVKTKDLDTNKKKIKVLADSDYSNSVKSTIYEETTGKSDKLYQILKKDKININEYLKYKEQGFESDRKDDGTTSGKAISGSKKRKVYNYVNSMNITYKQKLLLLGAQYKLTANERKELAYYINSLPNTTKKEKLKIYEKLKGFTVYKNGKVSW